MSMVYRPPSPAAKPKALSIRMRLLVLALVAIVPLMVDRARLIEADRAERIAALSEEARALARQGAESQRELIIAVRSVVQVVARAHATLASSPESCGRFLAGASADASWIAGLSVVGANGRVICSSTVNSVGLDVSDRPYFHEALRAKTFVVGEQAVGRSRRRGRPDRRGADIERGRQSERRHHGRLRAAMDRPRCRRGRAAAGRHDAGGRPVGHGAGGAAGPGQMAPQDASSRRSRAGARRA